MWELAQHREIKKKPKFNYWFTFKQMSIIKIISDCYYISWYKDTLLIFEKFFDVWQMKPLKVKSKLS